MPQRSTSLLLAVLLAAALALVLNLTGKVKTLRAAVLRERQRAMLPRIGQYVPAHSTLDMRGDSVEIALGDERSRRVLLFQTSDCGFCKKEIPAWRSLQERLASRQVGDSAIISVSLDAADSSARAYALANAWSFSTIRLDDLRVRSLFRVLSVPTTVVIDGTGRILFARAGTVAANAGLDSVIAAVTAPRKDSLALRVQAR